MAERRMFAKNIIDSDIFLDMPLTTQALYFHLSMRADDDGFVNNPKRIQRSIGASEDDFRLLILKEFIIPFESGIIVIKHWKLHNYIRNDRYRPSVYIAEKEEISVIETGEYIKKNEAELGGIPTVSQTGDTRYPNGIPTVSKRETQVRLGESRVEEDSLIKDNLFSSKKETSTDSPAVEGDEMFGSVENSVEKSQLDFEKQKQKKLEEFYRHYPDAKKGAVD